MFWKWLFRKKKPAAPPPPAPKPNPVVASGYQQRPIQLSRDRDSTRSTGHTIPARVMEEFNSTQAKVRRDLIPTLQSGLWQHSGYRDLLEKLAHDHDKHVRVAAVRAIGRRSMKSGETLEKALTDPHLGVRLEAVRALGTNPSDWGRDALIGILRGSERELHAPAAASLRDIHGDEVIDALIEAISPSYTTITRRKALRSLAEKRSPRGVEPILKAIADRNHNIQSMAARSLSILIRHLPQNFCPEAVETLKQIGLSHDHAKVRLHSAYNLAYLKDSSGAALLREAIASEEPIPYLTKARVFEALNNLPQQSSIHGDVV